MSFKAYFLEHDIFERHKIVSSFIPGKSKILDVGGEPDTLSLFLPDSQITVSNLSSGDIIADALNYNFGKGRYDFVTAVDVLEHIRKEDRQRFVDNLVKAASEKVIISAPLGTWDHMEYEKSVLEWHKSNGFTSDYLEEHIKLGLPTLPEVQNIAKKYHHQIIFSGYLPFTSFWFHFFNYQLKNGKLNRGFYLLKKWLNLMINIFWSISPWVGDYSQSRVRFYLVITK